MGQTDSPTEVSGLSRPIEFYKDDRGFFDWLDEHREEGYFLNTTRHPDRERNDHASPRVMSTHRPHGVPHLHNDARETLFPEQGASRTMDG